MSVITISRQFGAGGRTLGKMIAKELGLQLLDELVIQELAEKARVSTDYVKSMERTAGGKVSKFISGVISSDYIERLIGVDKGYLDEHSYVELLHEVLTDFAKQDNVVFLGRGGQYILQNAVDTYHILLVGVSFQHLRRGLQTVL